MYWQLTVTGNPGLDDTTPGDNGQLCPTSGGNDHI